MCQRVEVNPLSIRFFTKTDKYVSRLSRKGLHSPATITENEAIESRFLGIFFQYTLGQRPWTYRPQIVCDCFSFIHFVGLPSRRLFGSRLVRQKRIRMCCSVNGRPPVISIDDMPLHFFEANDRNTLNVFTRQNRERLAAGIRL